VISAEPRGTEGFGYDPYFLSSDLGRTFAEATVEEKEGVSHRGRAFRALVAALTAEAHV
jgi:XTP/dITP diphosphohydrolase